MISSDGQEFIIKREYALTSGTIKSMLSGPGQFCENESNEVYFREIPWAAIFEISWTKYLQICFRSHVLAKVCQYFIYRIRYTNSASEIPEFEITPEIALELLMAANFLDCWFSIYCFYHFISLKYHFRNKQAVSFLDNFQKDKLSFILMII